MSHLSPSELIDLLDGVLPPSREVHSRECARCRDEAARARLALEEARAVETPEPSPLFWEHFTSRVGQAVRSGPPPARWTMPDWRPAPVLAAIATLVLVAGGFWYSLDFSTPRDAAPGEAIVQPLETRPLQDDLFLDANGESWDLVAQGAAALEWEEVGDAGFTVRPGAAERALLQLSDEQQAELARLLEAEIGRLPS